jgi:Transposase DNA-binding
MSKRQGFAALQSDGWIDSELARCTFQDTRHGKRLRKLLEQLSENIGGTIPWACQDWANTKAAYRFFSNERVSEEEILGGHCQATRDRLEASSALILNAARHDRVHLPSQGSQTHWHPETSPIWVRKRQDSRGTIPYAAF